MLGFVWPVRVYYEDTDSGGVVYHANYLKFMERARTEYLRLAGFEQDQLRSDENLVFAVHSINLEYLSPARFNDLLEVTATIKSSRRASFNFYQEIRRKSDHAKLCTANIRIACVNATTFRPQAIPQLLQSSLMNVD